MASKAFWYSMSFEDSVGVGRCHKNYCPILCPIRVQISGFQCLSRSDGSQRNKCRKPLGEKGLSCIESHRVPTIKTALQPAVNRRIAQTGSNPSTTRSAPGCYPI